MAEKKGHVSSKRSIGTKYKNLDKKFKVLIVFGIIFCIVDIPMIIWSGIWAYNTYAVRPDPFEPNGDGDDEPPVPPPIPTLYTITTPDNDGNIEDISWSSVSGATGYSVFFMSSGGTWSMIKTTSGTSCDYNAGLSDGTYYFGVKAVNEAGFSSMSNTVFVVVAIQDGDGNGDGDEDENPPEKPILKNIIPAIDNDGSINLIWEATDGADDYEIQRSKDGGSWITIKYDYSGTSYIDPGLTSGTYEYKIIAQNDYGNTLSDIKSVVVSLIVNYPPENPEISINDGDDTTDSFSITLTLSCDNAQTMSFRISVGGIVGSWTDPETFDFFKLLPLPEVSNNSVYTIAVKFSNDFGNIEATDEITLVLDYSNGNGDGNGEEETDYTMIYILVGVLVGISVIAVILTWLKKRR